MAAKRYSPRLRCFWNNRLTFSWVSSSMLLVALKVVPFVIAIVCRNECPKPAGAVLHVPHIGVRHAPEVRKELKWKHKITCFEVMFSLLLTLSWPFFCCKHVPFFLEDSSYHDMIAKKIPKTYFACEKKNYKILLTLVLQNLLLFCAQNKNQRQLF